MPMQWNMESQSLPGIHQPSRGAGKCFMYKLNLITFVQISEGKAEQGLKVLLELPPNSISNTQRLEVLRSAFNKQSEMGVTKSFVQV